MSLLVVIAPGLQYEGETVRQMRDRERRAARHNAKVLAELERWKPSPAKMYWPWCRVHAPHLLPPWAVNGEGG